MANEAATVMKAASKRKPKKDRNLSLSPMQILHKRIVRETLFYWLFIFLVLFAGTVAVIQAGPFGLTLEVVVDSSAAHDETLAYAGGILGGFSLLWAFVAFLLAVVYYRIMVGSRTPKAVASPASVPLVAPTA